MCEHSCRIITIAVVSNQIYACLCVKNITLVYCIRRIEFNFRHFLIKIARSIIIKIHELLARSEETFTERYMDVD